MREAGWPYSLCLPTPLRVYLDIFKHKKTARPSVQSGGCRFAFMVLIASSNVSDQTDYPAGSGILRILERHRDHTKNISCGVTVVNGPTEPAIDKVATRSRESFVLRPPMIFFLFKSNGVRVVML